MDNPAAPKSVLETLRTVEFRLGLQGYDVDEVDDYLEKVAVEADALQEQLRQMNDRLRQAAERIAQLEAQKRAEPEPAEAPRSGGAVAAAAATAAVHRVAAAHPRDGAALRRPDQARVRGGGGRVVAEANEQARRLQAEAEQRYKADLSSLEGLKTKLTSDVEEMARQLETERTRLRTSLSEMIKWIEDNVQPGAAIMALRQSPGSRSAGGACGWQRAPSPLPTTWGSSSPSAEA